MPGAAKAVHGKVSISQDWSNSMSANRSVSVLEGFGYGVTSKYERREIAAAIALYP